MLGLRLVGAGVNGFVGAATCSYSAAQASQLLADSSRFVQPSNHLPPLAPASPSRPAGTGYTLQMDTAFLYSSDSFVFATTINATGEADPLAPFPCVGALCGKRPAANTAPDELLVPLYGDQNTVGCRFS